MKKIVSSIIGLILAVILINISFAGDSAINVAKKIIISYSPGTTIEELINSYPYYNKVKWSVRNVNDSISTVVASCNYDCEAAGSVFEDMKQFIVQYIFSVYTEGSQHSGRIADIELIKINENNRTFLRSHKNGLLSNEQIIYLLQMLITNEIF